MIGRLSWRAVLATAAVLIAACSGSSTSSSDAPASTAAVRAGDEAPAEGSGGDDGAATSTTPPAGLLPPAESELAGALDRVGFVARSFGGLVVHVWKVRRAATRPSMSESLADGWRVLVVSIGRQDMIPESGEGFVRVAPRGGCRAASPGGLSGSGS